LNLFSRSKSNTRSSATIPDPGIFLTLPPLKRDVPPTGLYIVPRLLSRATGEVTHLDNAISGHPRAILTGASGLGKSSALAFLSAGANAPVLSLADYHPGALPEHLPNETWILLDDIGDPAHVLYLQELARKFPSAKIWAVTRDPKLVPADFAQLELQSFNEREIVSMAEAWLPLPVEKGHTARRINRAAQDLIASVQANAGTRELAINPLCLYLLLQVYEPAAIRAPVVEEHVALPMIGGNAATPFDVPQRTRVAQLPARRAQLFDAYVSAKLAAEPDPDFAARALEGIALSTRRGQRATQEHLARGYGLLEQRQGGRVEFKHSLLQDFLAARALRRNPDFAPMREHMEHPDWREVALFYAGLGGAGDVARVALEKNDLAFAADALAAVNDPPLELTEQTVKALVARAWDDGDADAAQVLGTLRNNMASDFFAAKLRDKNADVRLRAAAILGKLHTDRALEYLLPQLRDPSTEVREQVIASLGASRSERVVEPLLVALRGDPRVAASDTRLKIAAARALGEYGTDKAVPALIVDVQVSDDPVREQAVIALEKIRSSFAVKPLTQIAQTDKKEHVRAAAQRVLDNMQGVAAPPPASPDGSAK
jgi:hypothetical protein